MFKTGDVVVYSATGVCKISDICLKNFGGSNLEYYVLTPLMQKASTVFIPVENEHLTKKMHPILSKPDFENVFCSAKKKEPIRPESENERREKFSEILDSGDREALMLMVYDLINYKTQQANCGRRLHIADERLLNSAQTLLFEELAYVFEIDIDGVSEFIGKKFN